MTVIRSSQMLNRIVPPPDMQPRRKVPWPKGDGRWKLIPPEAIPRGMQSLQAIVPMRLATCEEVECPRWLRGWTEVASGGKVHQFPGHMSAEEIVATNKIGMQGDRLPIVTHHAPGGLCDIVHKVPSGAPPIYITDGRPVVESEFLDRLGGGVEAVTELRKRG